ncbi:DUF1631 domain-containing protein [Oleiagrimonas soli]|uniref:Thymidine phosphorylase n=1 Tax=Oleiagrimonas soli TaxID=1543381 RepID=A0A099D0D8_9GAMM|nr:DUF1631 domain-containing protein [Oleiagrimonas soli]KGI78745.1 hypothetical protein LF63_0104255 [Oleiagrimonas soli]MBB6184035.1 hypothetical protein [Oleiagrimonas soli]
MNNVNERSHLSNIVDLAERSGSIANDPRNERVGELLASVRGVSTRHLMSLMGSMFDNVDDALFDLAEKAENNAVQTQYFDGMRDVRKKRPLIERSFIDMITGAFSKLAGGQRHAHGETQNEQRAFGGSPELSLVDERDLEESLAVTSMTSKAEGRLSHSLFAVNQRLTVICGGTKVDNVDNPIGPATLTRSFGEAMSELKVEVRVKLIVFKLFERYVLNNLEPLYEEINHTLIQAGVLPQLRTPGAKRSTTTQPRPQQRNEANAAQDVEGDDNDNSMLRTKLVETLQSLLAERRQTYGYGQPAMGNSGPSLSPAELLGALSVLQGEVARSTVSMPTQIPIDTTLSAEDVRLLKEQLVRQISHLRGEAKSYVSGADEDTIDLISMLFEYILQDHNLPMEMQVLLARLQIPYLKAAILDRRLFAHANHPARRLLDELAEAAKSWSAESDRDQRLLGKVRSVVETLLSDFDDDIEVFNRQLDEFRKFLDGSNRRAQLAEQRAAEATRGREKLQQARRRAAQEILSRIDGRELPALVNGILTRAWANYLVLTLLRHGEESKEFRVGLRFVDDFVWSVGPIRSDVERARLNQLLPLLEKSLRHGLATVAFQDADVENLMRQLNTLYNGQLNLREEVAVAQTVSEAMPIPDSMEAIATPETLSETEETAKPAVQPDSPEVQRVRALKVGTWVEFQADSERPERAKLSWISPISGKYLFVNRRGLKVADKTLDQFASELASGQTVVLEELPLFDRALDAIVERLRTSQSTPNAEAPKPNA